MMIDRMSSEIIWPPVFDAEDEQLIVFGLAWLALDKPGWDYTLSVIASKFHRGKEMFENFKRFNADRVKQEPIDTPSNKILEEMNRYI